MHAPVFDYYAVLGVERTAGVGQLRRAYRMLALQFHPDRAGIQSTEVFQRIAEAYSVLSDAAARASYDQRLRAAETSRFGQRVSRGSAGVGQGTSRAGGFGDVMEGDAYGPGGKISWRRGGKRDPHRVDDLIDRFCGDLEALLARGAIRRATDGVLELLLRQAEALEGGTAAIDTAVEAACPTCFGNAHPGRLWCRRCDYAGTTRENVTLCIPIPPAVADGATFNVATDPQGRAAPMRVRIRVA
jgi:molecular chaperone DnaJ